MRKLLVALGLFVGVSAQAQTYKPDFNCSADHSKDSIATMLCQNSDAAKAELQFDQSYYALRQTVGKEGWKALKQEAIKDDDAFASCIDPSSADATAAVPQARPDCYISTMKGLTEKYRSRLSGAALQEASRDIDQHIALQQKLIDLGYLPSGTKADGVYGEGTRQAIATWQRVAHRPLADGFISDADAGILSGAQSPAAATNDYSSTNTSDLITIDESLDDKCRGGSGDNPNTIKFCNQRDAVTALLAKRNVCLESDKKWIECQPAPQPRPAPLADRTVNETIVDRMQLNGKTVSVVGSIFCASNICQIMDPGSMNPIIIGAAGKLSRETKLRMLGCGAMNDECHVRIIGTLWITQTGPAIATKSLTFLQ